MQRYTAQGVKAARNTGCKSEDNNLCEKYELAQ